MISKASLSPSSRLKDLKLKRAAILTDVKNDYSTGLTTVLSEEFPKLGGTIVARESYQAGDTSFKTQLTNIKAANPDIVFLPGYYTEITTILKDALRTGPQLPLHRRRWLGSPILPLKTGGKRTSKGVILPIITTAAIPDPRVVDFVQKFKTRCYNGEVPDAMAVLGYDAANILFAAIDRAKSTEGPAIRDSLGQTKDFPGATGNITINKDRNAIKPAVVLTIKDGKFQLVKRVNP